MTHQNQTNARHVCILGFRDVLLMDVAGPAQVFGSANTLLGHDAYRIESVTRDGAECVTDTGLALCAAHGFADMREVDDFVIPGGPGIDRLLDDAPTRAFIARMGGVADRVISICSGSLLTASAGLLTGRVATTHWERTALVHDRFPDVDWHLDNIFTQDGKFRCSAGVTAGIDLALSLVEADHGRPLALAVAREMVVFMQRDGGQSQYSRPLRAQSTPHARLSRLYARIEADPAGHWSVQQMAQAAGTTERTLHRDVLRDHGMSPSQFVEERRLSIARLYLERSAKSLKEIAMLSGFVNEQKLRRSFTKQLGVLPSEYRNRFGQGLDLSDPV